MIRIANRDDINRIIELLNFELKECNIEKLLNDWSNEGNIKLIHEENNNVYGFSIGAANGEIIIYVSEIHRRIGIGEALHSKVINYFNKNNIKESCSEIRVEKNSTGDFFKDRGYNKWFSYQKMKYRGKTIESNFNLVNYNDDYYYEYKRIYEECFFKMRKSLNLQPYNCCDSYDELSKKKNEIFLLIDDEELIGSVSCINNEIDDLIVNTKYQKQGYGKELLKFAIQNMQHRGVENISLGVAHWNTNAIRLYENNGFSCGIVCEVYKKIVCRL